MHRLAPFILLFLICACKSNNKSLQNTNTPTAGMVNVVVDDAYTSLFTTLKKVFEHTYKNATIKLKFTTEADAVQEFSLGTTPLICISRQLTNDELKGIKDRGYYIKVIPFAADAIAFICSANIDSTYTEQEMLNILITGKPNERSKNNFNVVFDKNNTGTASYLRDSILMGQELGKNCYALNSTTEVFDYVRNNNTAIGVLAVNHISDTGDEQVRSRLKGLHIIAISRNHKPYQYLKPDAEHVKDGSYPFLRNLYLISGEGTNGLATGFAAFITSDIGMTIIDKIGLKPAKDPVRVIEIRKSFE